MSYREARLTRRTYRKYQYILQAAADERELNYGELEWPPTGAGRRGSGLAWAAWGFAKRWHARRDVDVKKLQRIVLDWGSGECVYRFARDVPGANVKRCQAAVMEDGDPGVLRSFAANVPGAHSPSLEALAIIAEVMGG